MGQTEMTQVPKLRSWNDLTREIALPAEFALGVMTGRQELLRMINRPLSVEEARQVARAMAILIETNQALQDHYRHLAEMVRQADGLIKGLPTKLTQLEGFTEFRSPVCEDDAGQ
jgi:hypothetical protein